MNQVGQGRPPRKFRLPRLPVRLLDFALALTVTASAVLLFAYSGIGGNTRAGFAFLQNIELRSLDFRFAFRVGGVAGIAHLFRQAKSTDPQ